MSGENMAGSTQIAGNKSNHKPLMTFFQIWNMAFGFFGLQIGFALQNANASRIFQSLGADLDALPLLWLAGPITGLIVQPIVGYFSDKTWGRFGRRRPYFFVGALLATIALFVMPNSPYLWMAAGSLWILDAALNISMEPFRAFVGDNLNSKQRTLGYALQGFMIGAGGWRASKLPNFLTEAGFANTAAENQVPDSVKYAFIIGGVLLFLSVLWTILTSKEYDPDTLEAFERADTSENAKRRQVGRPVPEPGFFTLWGIVLLAVGFALQALIYLFETDKQFIVFATGVMIVGAMFLYNGFRLKNGGKSNMIGTVLDDLATMPKVMKRLAAVQFTSWFAFFILWIYLTPAITSHYFGTTDPSSEAYGEGSLSVNNIFALYSLVAWGFSLLIPLIVKAIGLKPTYALSLVIGGLSFASLYFIGNPKLFWICATGIGIVWACVLTLPYAILADALPFEKMGMYMGIFNFFIVIPQIVVGTVMGPVVKSFLGDQAILALVVGGVVMLTGAVLLLFVPYEETEKSAF